MHHSIEAAPVQIPANRILIEQVQLCPRGRSHFVTSSQTLCQVAPDETARPCNQNLHQQVLPPSTTRFAPVMYDDASEHRNRIAPRYSSRFAMRPMGINWVSFATNSSGCPLYTPPGEMTFTRTPRSAQYVAR